jgi:hypothetical protein
MYMCNVCQKNFCNCQNKTRKIIKKLRNTDILNASFKDESLYLRVFSLKKGEYCVKIALKIIYAEIIETFTSDDSQPIVNDFINREIINTKYVPNGILMELFSHDRKEHRYVEIRKTIQYHSPEKFVYRLRDYKIEDF